MIISLSVLNGFKREITSKVIGFGAHIQLSKYDNNNSFEPQPIDVTPAQLEDYAKSLFDQLQKTDGEDRRPNNPEFINSKTIPEVVV